MKKNKKKRRSITDFVLQGIELYFPVPRSAIMSRIGHTDGSISPKAIDRPVLAYCLP